MASWMVHLRVADKLLDRIPGIDPTCFIVGNMAPDSGVPNEDWSSFTPSTAISHFRSPGKKADPDAFAAKYFTPQQRLQYSNEAFSFYLGYLTHLMTDVLWSSKIVHPSLDRYPEEVAKDRTAFIWTLKKDWYDLDFKYLQDHPELRAFQIYLAAEGFRNSFMEEFSATAFDDRRRYITGFYLSGRDGLHREYLYLPEAEMDRFVDSCAEEIMLQLKDRKL